MGPSQANGIHNPNIGDENRVAYDIFQVLNHRLSWDNPNESARQEIEQGKRPFGVNFDEPLKASAQPLPKFTGDPYQCKHHAKEIPGDYYAEDEWRSDGARCADCGYYLGWYCPKSPDHYCHYDGHMSDDVPPRFIKNNSDSCDFCGMPDERK